MRKALLKEVCLDFVVPQRDKPKVFDGDIPWCRIEDIEGRYLNGSKSGRKVSKELADKMNMHLCPKGSVICACSASIGNQAITTIDCYTNQTFIGIVPNPELLNNVYLYYFFAAQAEVLKGMGQGATIKYISQDKFKTLPIPLPSLPEQQRIVDILDREFAGIDALKANAEKSLQAAKDLFQATLKKELEPKEGWKKYCLKGVCTDYGDYGMSLPSKAYESIRYLRITDITEWGELNNDRVSVDTDVIDDRYMLKEGDVLFARTGATVGKTLVYEDAFGDCCYAGYLIRYRPNQNIVLPRMLYFITHSASYYEWVATNQKSATLPNISAKLYNAFELSLPSIKEQKEIVSRLDDLANKSKALNGNYQKTLTLCDDLKQSILRKAFNGEL